MANEIARQLRKRLTPQEVKLWIQLRTFKPLGFHFRKQVPIGPYIVDFACLKHSVVVEADGGQHGMSPGLKTDAIRDAVLVAQGFAILRFWNSDIDRNLRVVMETILARLENPHPGAALTAQERRRPVHPPHKGEG